MAQKTIAPLSNDEVAAFCSQMGMILTSGISSIEGIHLMLEESGDPEEQALLGKVNDKLVETGNFYEALECTKAYPDYMLQMVQIGEDTGKLDEVMKALATHYERESAIARSIRSAITYPLVMIVMMILVILVLITKVMPVFQQVFRQLGSEMTGFSKAVLDLGNLISRYSVVLAVLLVLIVALILYFSKTKSGRRQFSGFLTHFGATRSYIERIASCRFASGMALTLSSGMNPDQCIEYAERLTDNAALSAKLSDCRKRMDEGGELSASLSESGIFSGIYARMASIGSRTGVIDEVMQEIADKYQEEIDRRLTGIIAALEPALVIILSLIIGMILLSVMLPLMGIMTNL